MINIYYCEDIMKTNSIIRLSDLRDNKNAYRTANRKYYMVYLADNGKLTPCLFSEYDVLTAADRAVANPEDVVELSMFQFLYNKVLSLFKK